MSSLVQAVIVVLMLALLTVQLHPPFITQWLPLDALVLLGLIILLPASAALALASLSGVLYALMLLIVLSALAMAYSLNRPFNLMLDAQLLLAGFDVFSGSVGTLWAMIGTAIAILFIGLLGYLCTASLIRLNASALAIEGSSGSAGMPSLRLRTSLALLIGAALYGGYGFYKHGVLPKSAVLDLALQQMDTYRRSLDSTSELRRQMQDSPTPAMAMERLGQQHTLLTFVESYGVSALLDAPYKAVLRPRLKAIQADLELRGIHMATGRLRSPVQGGQSWLAHATVLSGLWIDDQFRYDELVRSDATTLVDDFSLTGHDTLAVMPAITAAWPDGERLGYDQIADNAGLGYAGPALNWVTMPDQYTLSWLRDTLAASADQPVFAEIALISSHAPWTPVLPVLDDWDAIGNGMNFHRLIENAETPESLWQDPERVRAQYARAVDYSLGVIGSYARSYLGDSLLIVLGDHQAAPIITGDGASLDVPVHVISRDRALVAAFLAINNFRPGIELPPASASIGMDKFRGLMHRLFQDPPVVADQPSTSTQQGTNNL
ncbi:alkaline phosphatase [Allohahella marinimesophila]|uniref:Phosphoglycerol transferase MdoB-like AlkP superfamily enzyme n=1 Tax=Allohahella marinimesophila TaxID=1054972 RepID=A0ABP7PRU3_9GAMM